MRTGGRTGFPGSPALARACGRRVTGPIASSTGRPRATPAPRRKVLRDIGVLVIPGAPSLLLGKAVIERVAESDRLEQRERPVPVLARGLQRIIDDALVEPGELAPQRIPEQLPREMPDELILPREKNRLQLRGRGEGFARGQGPTA